MQFRTLDFQHNLENCDISCAVFSFQELQIAIILVSLLDFFKCNIIYSVLPVTFKQFIILGSFGFPWVYFQQQRFRFVAAPLEPLPPSVFPHPSSPVTTSSNFPTSSPSLLLTSSHLPFHPTNFSYFPSPTYYDLLLFPFSVPLLPFPYCFTPTSIFLPLLTYFPTFISSSFTLLHPPQLLLLHV